MVNNITVLELGLYSPVAF